MRTGDLFRAVTCLAIGILVLWNTGCTHSRPTNEVAPLSHEKVRSDTEIAYFKHSRKWYRISTQLSYQSASESQEKKVRIASLSKLQVYNPSSKEYEDFIGGKIQRLSGEFTVEVDSTGQPKYLYGSGTGGGGGSVTGLKDTYFNSRLSAERLEENDAKSCTVRVVATVEMTETESESRSLAEASVKKDLRFEVNEDGEIGMVLNVE